MGGKNTNQLEFSLNNTGEVISYVLTLVPVAFYMYINGVSRVFIITVLILTIVAGILSWYRPQRALANNLETALVIAAYHTLFGVAVLLVVPAGSSIVFLGVMFSALTYYSFGQLGLIISGFANIAVVMIQFLLLGDELDYDAFASLLSIVAMMALLTYFIRSIINVAQDQLNSAAKANKNIKLEHQRLVSLVNNIGDAVIATDEEGRIQTYNGAALQLLDTNTSLTGTLLNENWRLENENREAIDLIAEAKRANRNITRSDLKIRYGDDDEAKLYVNITPIKVGFGESEQKGFTIIMRDITKEKSLDEERDEFISVVSHELRTPITITEGKVSNAQLLISKQEIDKEKISTALDEVHNQVVFLANMINDLSTLSRAERTDAKLDIEPIDPHTLLEDLMKSYEPEASQKGLEIKLVQPSNHLNTIYTNKLYLQEVLQNFVTNALKYTKQGSITLEARQDGRRVRFSVTDTGIGISKSDQKRIFDKFYRSEDFRTRESSGTGLGLYVTAKLASKLNAKIEIASELNKGSIFSLVAPSLAEKPRNHSRSRGR